MSTSGIADARCRSASNVRLTRYDERSFLAHVESKRLQPALPLRTIVVPPEDSARVAAIVEAVATSVAIPVPAPTRLITATEEIVAAAVVTVLATPLLATRLLTTIPLFVLAAAIPRTSVAPAVPRIVVIPATIIVAAPVVVPAANVVAAPRVLDRFAPPSLVVSPALRACRLRSRAQSACEHHYQKRIDHFHGSLHQLATQMLGDELRHCSDGAKPTPRRKALWQLELRRRSGEQDWRLS